LTQVVLSRWEASFLAGKDIYALGQIDRKELERRAKDLVARAGTLEILVNMFVDDEAKDEIPPTPGYEWAATEVNRILGIPHESRRK
jgi:hypothetical protein